MWGPARQNGYNGNTLVFTVIVSFCVCWSVELICGASRAFMQMSDDDGDVWWCGGQTTLDRIKIGCKRTAASQPWSGVRLPDLKSVCVCVCVCLLWPKKELIHFILPGRRLRARFVSVNSNFANVCDAKDVEDHLHENMKWRYINEKMNQP